MQRSGSIEPDAGRKMQETILLQLALGQLTDSSIVQARLEQSGWKALVNYRLGCLFTEEVSLFFGSAPRAAFRTVAERSPRLYLLLLPRLRDHSWVGKP